MKQQTTARLLSQKEQKQLKGGQDNNFWVCVGFRPVFPNRGDCNKFCRDHEGKCEKQVFE